MRLQQFGPSLVALLAASGCGAFDPPPAPPPYKAAIVVHGDPAQPLAGVTVATGKAEPLITGLDGRAELVLRGAEGDIREVRVTCPPGHQPVGGPISIRLTRLTGTKIPEYTLSCPPLRRKIVVAIRAENGPYLPVKYLNQVVATTDQGGAAHFALEIEPGSFSVGLDTSDRKDLKPPSPSRVMTVGQQDDILLFDQRFEVEKKPVIIHRVQIAKKIGG